MLLRDHSRGLLADSGCARLPACWDPASMAEVAKDNEQCPVVKRAAGLKLTCRDDSRHGKLDSLRHLARRIVTTRLRAAPVPSIPAPVLALAGG